MKAIDLQRRTAAAGARIRALSTRVESRAAESPARQETIEGLEAEIRALSGRLESKETESRTRQETIDRLQTEIRDLSALGESKATESQSRQETIERLQAEIRRLKGEPGPPPEGTKKALRRDVSSEKERREPKVWSKRSKNASLEIDRTVTVKVDRTRVPEDVVSKGFMEVVVQDLIVRKDTIRFRREKLYSPSAGHTYLGPMPPGFEGQFGPGLKAWVLLLAFGSNVSEAKIREFLTQAGVQISTGGLSNLLIQGKERFHAEKAAVFEAGLKSSPWQHLDETGTTVKGVRRSCHVVGTPLSFAYFTLETKGRLGVLQALQGGRPPRFLSNARAQELLEATGLPQRVRSALAFLPPDVFLEAADLEDRWTREGPAVGPRQRSQIWDALALAAYETEVLRPRLLVCDDAPQFKKVTHGRALCWVHEGRHIKKLQPFLPLDQERLEAFLTEFWAFYRELKAYAASPAPAESERLSARFNALFTPDTGYADLDARIALIRSKRTELLQVLEHPEVPLHNNPAELAARRRVRKRDVSFGPQNPAGTRAWDTFMTLAATTALLGISFHAYLEDRITQAGQIPPLASLIAPRAKALALGASWDP